MPEPLQEPVQLDVFYSYACRDTYEVFDWLRRVRRDGVALDVTWRPYAIQMGEDDRYWRRPWDEASSELRGFIAAEVAHREGDDAFRRFHAALEEAVHEEFLELAEEETLLGAAEQADIALEPFRAAFASPAEFARAARRSHERAESDHDIFGTPTLVFPNGQAVHVELRAIPPADDAQALLQAIHSVAVAYPYVGRLTRTTSIQRGTAS